MADAEPFVDFYDILQVHPQCEFKALEAAYRDLAKTYHPDHPETADADRFQQVLQAYRALKNPKDRAKYDIEYSIQTGFSFESPYNLNESEKVALSDGQAHSKILLNLYKRRREFASDPGLGQYSLQQILNCSDESFEFYIWYLRGKGFIEYTEEGTLAITITGVDHVISMSQVHEREKLQIGQSNESRSNEDGL
ncbi:MAG: DnaJ domain-containing protein [Erythrobacter sp.]|jgi:curved DNA-binding protein|nr:DnaJ domain-containing protein [Erythrobacter sp.]